MSLRFAFLPVMVGVLWAGCAPGTPENVPSEPAEEGDEALGGETYFAVRRDFRKCAYPMCGGYWLDRLNRTKTQCVDGSMAPECYVAEIDLAALGLSEEATWALLDDASNGHAILSGAITPLPGTSVGRLEAVEGWTAQVRQGSSTKTVYRVTDLGITCVTFPCLSFEEQKLNSAAAAKQLGDVDLFSTGVSDDVAYAGYEAMRNGGALVLGSHTTVTGPAGKAKMLTASEFYLPVVGKADCDCGPALGMPNVLCEDGVSVAGPTGVCLQHEDGSCGWEIATCPAACGDAFCGEGFYCCNSSCGICAPEGGACIQIACN